MTLFTARMSHTRDTVRRFTKVQYDTFEFGRKVLLVLLSAALVVFGALQMLRGTSVLGIACMLIGCVVLTNRDARSEAVADSVADAMGGKFPCLQYSFGPDSFTDGEGRPEVPYGKLYRLIADEQYLYLFTSKASGYMVETASLTHSDTAPSGKNAADELRALLAERSGLSWGRPLSLRTVSLRDLIALIKAKKHS